MDILSLISSLSYSPLALRHLPQPVPSDLPPELDAKIFTFQDAFEDLLAVSTGRMLPEINTRYQQRRLLQDMFRSGEPAWFWMRRLESQGLVQPNNRVWLPQTLPRDSSTFHEELEKVAIKIWHDDNKRHSNEDHGSSDLLGDRDKVIKQLERVLVGRDPAVDDASFKNRTASKEPVSFEELFSDVSSMFKENTSSWDTFIQTITKDAIVKPNQNKQAQHDSRGNNEVVATEDEYVDKFGYLHKTVTRKILNTEGKEVGNTTYVTIRSTDKSLSNEVRESSKTREHINDGTVAKKLSWFWK
ncbi:hypothetical protein QQS21_007834 [Conoideocrella luteorostrata]|uniref:Uncharacterized protein n=1 Tax=Conoideocrella luteorostrata TaxID=1105319 RepID=A0AAJ0CKA6_9HYPO|nr:hypothetical protein QQS21_007834 [Conoideocrella luteorostrata]